MKRFLSLLLVFTLLFAVQPVVYAASSSDLTFTLNSDGKSYSVTNCSESASGALTIPSTYNGKPVTSIGSEAFSSCQHLTSVKIPSSVTSIGSWAFTNCYGLTSVSIPSSVTSIGEGAFYLCSDLVSVTIPQGITEIENHVFYGCSSLPAITIPNGVTSIGYRAFSSCSSLSSITIPKNVTFIGYEAFGYCDSLTSMTIPDNVTSTGGSLFLGCENLTSVVIGDGITEINNGMFGYCSSLRSVSLGSNITTIGIFTFSGCENLVSITIPKGVTKLEYLAFSNCYSLQHVWIEEGNEYYCNDANGVVYNKSKSTLLLYPAGSVATTYSIPDHVTKIGPYAFNDCQNLKSVTVGENVYDIEREAFSECVGLTSASISCSVIRAYAFADCINLKTVTIPDNVYRIEYHAFSGCSSLNTVNLPNTVSSIEWSAFEGCSSLKDVWYGGTEYEKTIISIDSEGNTDLLNATWHCVECSGHVYDNDCDETCNICGVKRKVSHSDFIWVIDRQPTCGVNGLKHEECTVCGTKRNENTPIAATGDHTYTGACDEYCDVCGTRREATHYEFAWVIDRQPTCGVNGLKHEECTVCGTKRNENTPIAATGNHTYSVACDTECDVCGMVRTTADPHTTTGYSYSFTNATNYPYKLTNGVYNSTNKAHSSTATATINILYDDSFTIEYYTSTEYSYDHLIIRHNNSQIVKTSGDTAWKTITLNAKTGDVITITYEKDSMVSSANDAVYFKLPNVTLSMPADSVEPTCTEGVVCDLCGTTVKEALGHRYTDACDSQCNYCEVTRTPPHAGYKWVVDQQETCGVAGTKHEECTACGATRNSGTVIPATGDHTYSVACDPDCNVCGMSNPNPEAHTYSTDYDTKCDLCGITRSLDSEEVTQNNLTYRIDPSDDGGTATLLSCSTSMSGKITVPSKVKGVAVTAVTGNAFQNCKYITGIVIPNSVTSIGNSAFKGCTGLYELELPFLDRTFAYLFGTVSYGEISNEIVPLALKKITINGGQIPKNSFKNCDDISIVVLGNNVTSVGASAFAECNSITALTVGDKVETIGESAFENCESLTKVTIGSGTKIIDDAAFRRCVSLSSITVGVNVTIIGDYAFQYCSSLENFTLPANLEQIGNYAFGNCSKLKRITIPNKVKLIGAYAFEDCSAMTDVTVGTSVTTIFEGAFSCCSSLKEIVLPSSTTSIGEATFEYCSSLKKAIFRGRTDHINNRMFYGCGNLTLVAFPENVDTIAYNAFSGCYNLADIWFEGTKTQKNNMVIAGGNDYLKQATWHYGQFDPSGHIYDSVCDSTCNICGAARIPPHNYVSNTCSRCGVERLHIKSQPGNAAAQKGKTVKTSVKAGGEGLKYTWYFKNRTATSYSKSSITTNTYTMTMDATKNGRMVYCVVKDKYGNSVTSEVATLFMGNPATITVQPKNAYVANGAQAKTTLTATGDGLTYTWYFRNAGATAWSKSSLTGNSYSVTMKSTTKGRQVYCVVKDKYGTSVKSNTVTLNMGNPLKITTQPTNAAAASGKKITVKISATGDGLTYTWYYKNKGASSYTKASTTTNTYSVTSKTAVNGRKVYCVVKDKYGNSVKSNEVTLYKGKPAKITTQPKTVTVANGKQAKVTVKASGDGLKYTWYFKNAGSSTWSKSSLTGNSYYVTMKSTTKNRQVYCVVTDKYGTSVKSNVVTLKMK